MIYEKKTSATFVYAGNEIDELQFENKQQSSRSAEAERR